MRIGDLLLDCFGGPYEPFPPCPDDEEEVVYVKGVIRETELRMLKKERKET